MSIAGRKRRATPTLLFSFGFSAVAVLFLLMMLVLFLWQSIPVWRHEGFGYLFGKQWFYRGQQFGALPMIYGTVVVAALALVMAAPVGIGTAIFIAEFLPARARLIVKIMVELLSGIPSVVERSTDDASNSRTSFRECRTRSLALRTVMPGSTAREQAGASTRAPSTSTTQSRHTFTGLSVSR